MISGVEVVLASGSPRRAQLLRALGVDFQIMPAPVSEDVDEVTAPDRVVEQLALRKATSIARARPEALVIGADTIVMLGDTLLGKPRTPREAEAMLNRLSGRRHVVYTGVAVVHQGTNRAVVAHETTQVSFAPITPDEIRAYVAGGSPMDKAGSYGIQEDLGAVFVSGIEGDFYNVMGLPVHRLYRLLKADFPEFVSLRSRLETSSGS